MVIGAGELPSDIRRWHTVNQDIMSGLDVEGFLNLCVWRNN